MPVLERFDVDYSNKLEQGGRGSPLFLDGKIYLIDSDTLLFATSNVAEDSLIHDLQGSGLNVLNIGYCTGPRQAPFVIY